MDLAFHDAPGAGRREDDRLVVRDAAVLDDRSALRIVMLDRRDLDVAFNDAGVRSDMGARVTMDFHSRPPMFNGYGEASRAIPEIGDRKSVVSGKSVSVSVDHGCRRNIKKNKIT